MSRDGPRRIAEVLQSGDISKLRAAAAERRSFAARVRAELPEPESSHVVGAHLGDDGSLVISMDSAAWAARLSMQLPELLGRTVRIKVAAPTGASAAGD